MRELLKQDDDDPVFFRGVVAPSESPRFRWCHCKWQETFTTQDVADAAEENWGFYGGFSPPFFDSASQFPSACTRVSILPSTHPGCAPLSQSTCSSTR